jgi:3-(methylthio)propanoyl-CoA dehydrogenase
MDDYYNEEMAAAATYIGCCCVDDIGLYKAVQDEH